MHACTYQQLASNPGLNLAQAPSTSVGMKGIQDLIEKDIPDVRYE